MPRLLLRKLWAFYKRDFLLQLTFRVTFFFGVAHAFGSLLMFFFIGRLVAGTGTHPSLAPYG